MCAPAKRGDWEGVPIGGVPKPLRMLCGRPRENTPSATKILQPKLFSSKSFVTTELDSILKQIQDLQVKK